MKRYLILLMIGVTAVSGSAAPKPVANPVDAYRAVVKSNAKASYSTAARRLRRWMVASDPHYPTYHFTSPVGWFNDPHPIYYKGKHHVFYNADFFPTKGRSFDNICWGHVVSDDLVHWADWPVVVWPDTQYDRRGVYSGNMFVDNKGPGGGKRRLLHAWVTGPRTPTKGVSSWQGASAIPRVLTLSGQRIWQEPIPEIQKLRGKHYSFGDLKKKDLLKDIKSDTLELIATFAPGSAKRFGIKLRVSPDGKKFTRICFDAKGRTFGVDGQSLKKGWQQSYLKPGQDVKMHIFLDRSIIEIYVNGSARTVRTFPASDALGLDIFSEGGAAKLKSLDAWEMKSMWQ